MPATSSRIGFVLRASRLAVAEDAGIAARYGTLARRHDEPVLTFFTDLEDAEAIAEDRQELLGAERRAFRVSTKDIAEIYHLLMSDTVPVAVFVDPERDITRTVLVSDIVIKLAEQTAEFTVWG